MRSSLSRRTEAASDVSTDQAKGCAGSPAWSPDGRRIAFVRQYDDPSGQNRDFPGEIYVVNADGSGTRQLTRRALRVETLKWSPDGRSVAFDRTGGVFLADARSSRVRPLAPRLRDLRQPDWSPDGARLAVTGPDASPGEKRPISRIYLLKRDGTALQPVTRGRPGDQDLLPSWSHDGQSLLFMRTSDEVWTVARDGAAGSGELGAARSVRFLRRGHRTTGGSSSWATGCGRSGPMEAAGDA